MTGFPVALQCKFEAIALTYIGAYLHVGPFGGDLQLLGGIAVAMAARAAYCTLTMYLLATCYNGAKDMNAVKASDAAVAASASSSLKKAE